MAYVPDNLFVDQSAVGSAMYRIHRYQTVSDSDGTLTGAGYFSDGVTKGMRVNDLVDVVATTGPKNKRYQVASVSGTAATIAAITAIT